MKEGQGLQKFQYQKNKGMEVLGVEYDSSKGDTTFNPSRSPVQSKEEVSPKLRGSSCWGGALGTGRPGWAPFSFCPPLPSSPSLFPLGKLKSELDMLVNKCPEEPLEGDMSSPNSTGTQVKGGALPWGPE